MFDEIAPPAGRDVASTSPAPLVEPLEIEVDVVPLGLKSWLALVAGAVGLFAAFAATAPGFELPDVGPNYYYYWGNYDLAAEVGMRSGDDALADADLIMLGTSRDVAGLWPEDRLEKAISDQVGRPIRLEALLAYNVWPMDLLFLANQLKEPRRVLISVNPQSFAWPDGLSKHLREIFFVRPPLDFIDRYKDRFEGLQAYASGLPRLTLQMKTKRRAYLRTTRFRLDTWFAVNFYGQPAVVADPLGRDATGDLEAQQQHLEGWILPAMRGFEQYQSHNHAVLEATIEYLQAQGAEVALMKCAVMDDQPEGPYRPFWFSYQTRVARLGEKYGVEVYDFNDAVDLGPEHFVDATHMGAPGRDVLSPVFVEAMAAWIEPGDDAERPGEDPAEDAEAE